LVWGFDDRLASAWLPLTGLPYYALYAADLRHAGYRARDVLRVYALNLLLIPVNLGGVLTSLRQACTGRRSPSGRTPKVAGRTAAPGAYVLAELVLLAAWINGVLFELRHHRPTSALFAGLNAAFLVYALVRFVGVRALCDDLQPLGSAVRAWLAPR